MQSTSRGRDTNRQFRHEPVSDIDTAVVDSLKVLDPHRQIREADIDQHLMLQSRSGF